jgi:hypothetical protein
VIVGLVGLVGFVGLVKLVGSVVSVGLVGLTGLVGLVGSVRTFVSQTKKSSQPVGVDGQRVTKGVTERLEQSQTEMLSMEIDTSRSSTPRRAP